MPEKFSDLNKESTGLKTNYMQASSAQIKENISTNTYKTSKEQILNQAFKFHSEGNLSEVEAFLELAVKKSGAPQRWLSLDKEYKRNLIGSYTRTSAEALADKLGDFDAQQPPFARYLRAIAKEAR